MKAFWKYRSVMRLLCRSLSGLSAVACVTGVSVAQQAPQTFKVNPPGVLKKSWGAGMSDYRLYAPGMRFPIDNPTTTLNSQIHGVGGMFGPGGSECAPDNYDEVWWDTYCEKRGGARRSSLCASREIHQGLDVRGGSVDTCKALKAGKVDVIPVLAVYDGHIVDIGSMSVTLATDRGKFKYLHLDMKRLKYRSRDLPVQVKAGDVIGHMHNDFGASPTTYHLHFEHWMAMPAKGVVPVPLYCDMVLAYERDRGKVAEMVGGGPRCGDTAAPAPAPPVSTPPASQPVATSPPATTTADSAQQPLPALDSYWTHNGSEVGLSSVDGLKFLYVKPRAGLAGLVGPGTVLFSGQRTGDDYVGKARAFSQGCEPVSYDVTGKPSADGTTITLRGTRPVPGPSCQIIREIKDVLVFNYVREPVPGAPTVLSQTPASGTPSTPVPSPMATGPGLSENAIAPAALMSALSKPRCSRAQCVDRQAFMAAYASLYRSLEKKDLDAYRVAALNSLFNIWDTTPTLEKPERLAYIVATVYHESFHMLYPIRECMCRDDRGSIACVKRLHEKGRASAYHLRDRDTQQSYYGRGQTQLTLRENFDRIAKKLGLNVDLVKNPDESLNLDISARNAVLGLYEGWYRAKQGRWISLKSNPFASTQDWLAARDVLISKRTHADRVASHGQKVLPLLKFISAAEFDVRYGGSSGAASALPAAPAEDAAVQTAPSPPMAVPAEQVAVQPPAQQPEAVAAAQLPPSAPTSSNDAALSQLATDIASVEQTAARLRQSSVDLEQQVAALKSKIEALRKGEPLAPEQSRIARSAEETPTPIQQAQSVDDKVDFKSVWPPAHKQHAWCGSGDKTVAGEIFDEDEEKLLDHYSAVPTGLRPTAVSGSTDKSERDDADAFIVYAPAIAPALPVDRTAMPKSTSSDDTWWSLPVMPRSVVRDTVKPLAPEASRS